MDSCRRRARISAISSRRGAKKERAREKRRGKRAISEKQNREIQIQKWVSSIRGRSCKCKRLKVGLDVRYAQVWPPNDKDNRVRAMAARETDQSDCARSAARDSSALSHRPEVPIFPDQ